MGNKQKQSLNVNQASVTVFEAVNDLITLNAKYDSKGNLRHRGILMAPDDIISRTPALSKLGIKYPVTPNSIKVQLPSNELLQALHYYMSCHSHSKDKVRYKYMDETALLAMGMIVEDLIDQKISENLFLNYMQPSKSAWEQEEQAIKAAWDLKEDRLNDNDNDDEID